MGQRAYWDCGSQLRALREAAKLSQTELAQILGMKYKGSVSSLESDRNPLIDRHLKSLERLGKQHPAEWAALLSRVDAAKEGDRLLPGLLPFEWDHISIVYRFERGRRPIGTTETRVVTARANGLERITMGHAERPEREKNYQFDLRVLYGGELERRDEESQGFVKATIRLATPMQRGERRLLMLQRVYSGKAEPRPQWRHGNEVNQTRKLIVGVQFADVLPARAWWFARLEHTRVPGQHGRHNDLQPNRLRYIEHDFKCLGLPLSHSGIAWEWD